MNICTGKYSKIFKYLNIRATLIWSYGFTNEQFLDALASLDLRLSVSQLLSNNFFRSSAGASVNAFLLFLIFFIHLKSKVASCGRYSLS